jgi:hypothetical protein
MATLVDHTQNNDVRPTLKVQDNVRKAPQAAFSRVAMDDRKHRGRAFDECKDAVDFRDDLVAEPGFLVFGTIARPRRCRPRLLVGR